MGRTYWSCIPGPREGETSVNTYTGFSVLETYFTPNVVFVCSPGIMPCAEGFMPELNI